MLDHDDGDDENDDDDDDVVLDSRSSPPPPPPPPNPDLVKSVGPWHRIITGLRKGPGSGASSAIDSNLTRGQAVAGSSLGSFL
ncbi:hypothetical protein IAQ61_011005 [Plenodomus lingam]|uniref:uncharacterized protein n=1 Tax=Leptosphaeria maculans TaxID=5022 RepID=UPI00331F7506|nr:hypothetical protein IAQ61_011005 [Plenodomus lingam]